MTALAARRFALWNDIIAPYIGINSDGNSSFEIVYRKGFENDSDALSRRPDLHHSITKLEDQLNESDLETANTFFSSMCHLHIDPTLTSQIKTAYADDSQYNGATMPRGVT